MVPVTTLSLFHGRVTKPKIYRESEYRTPELLTEEAAAGAACLTSYTNIKDTQPTPLNIIIFTPAAYLTATLVNTHLWRLICKVSCVWIIQITKTLIM